MLEVTITEMGYFNQLDERQQRLYLGLKAKLIGWHGVAEVSHAYQVNAKTVRKGKAELSELPAIAVKRIRKAGGGAKKK
ncbi:MAG: hypothetical protein ACKVTZ_12370 [Bacteroidia bacterium]